MKSFFFSILLLSFINGDAQKRWFKHIDGWGSTQSFVNGDTNFSYSSIHLKNGKSETLVVGVTLTKNDSSSLFKTIIYPNQFLLGANSLRLSSSRSIDYKNSLFYIGTLVGEDKGMKTYLTSYNPLYGILDTLNLKKDTHNIYINHVLIVKNKPVIFGQIDYSYSSTNTRYKSFITCYENGDKGWNHVFPFYEYPYEDWRVTSTFTNKNKPHFYYVHEYQQGLYVKQDYVVKMDTLGHELWRVAPSFPRDSINPTGMQVIEKSNGNILVSWCDCEYRPNRNPDGNPNMAVPNDNATIWFAEIDQFGNVIWKKNLRNYLLKVSGSTYTKMEHTKVITTEDEGVVYVGYYYNSKIGNFLPYLLKTDFEGNPKWFRHYNLYPDNTANNDFYPYDLTAAVDGGYILTGSYFSGGGNVFPNQVQLATIVKVDYNGCLKADCEKNDGLNLISKNLKSCIVSPNPANEHFSIQLLQNNLVYYRVLLISNTGKVVAMKTINTGLIWDTSEFPSGLYSVQIQNLNTNAIESHRLMLIH